MLLTISSTLLYSAFICYLIGTLLYGGTITRDKTTTRNSAAIFSKWGLRITSLGLCMHFGYFICRWGYTGHAPVSNMFEFTTAFSMFIIGAFLVLLKIYRVQALAVIALPIAILLIAYASMFPRHAAPLIPALKSHWLTIHVLTTVLGEAVLSISAFAGLLYVLKMYDGKKRRKGNRGVETILYSLLLVIGFIVSSSIFQISGYEAKYQYVDQQGQTMDMTYTMPAVIGMHDQIALEGAPKSIINGPQWLNGKKATSVIWSVLIGTILYGLIRLITRKTLTEICHPFAQKVSLPLLDELNYRAVLIGFPIFTLGALAFAMIWAQIAWSRMWGWDPKEVWALVTWLYYAAFLHLRLAKGWEGEKSAWLAVIGFGIIMFNLIVVNLILAGLHSYAA